MVKFCAVLQYSCLTLLAAVLPQSLVCVEPEEVALCAWCARALDVSGEGSGVTGAEFESISQQDTHSDPQWGSEGKEWHTLKTQVFNFVAELVSAGRDLETLSDVTLESHDTWGGLAPAPPQPELSEEVRQTGMVLCYMCV